MCSSACLLHILSAQIVGHFLFKFTMGDFLLKAFGQFRYSAVLTHNEFRFNWGHKLILCIIQGVPRVKFTTSGECSLC